MLYFMLPSLGQGAASLSGGVAGLLAEGKENRWIHPEALKASAQKKHLLFHSLFLVHASPQRSLKSLGQGRVTLTGGEAASIFNHNPSYLLCLHHFFGLAMFVFVYVF